MKFSPRIFLVGITLLSLFGCITPSMAPTIGTPQKPVKVLFIGNSYTYYNNMPEMLVELGKASGFQLRTEMIAKGGATLEEHWQEGAALEAIKSGGWDYVVLQPQSTFGAVYLVNGQERVADPVLFFRYARLFHEAIRKTGAKTVFPVHWKMEQAPVRDQIAIQVAYMQIGKELRAQLVPIASAWKAVETDHPEIDLYQEDGSHPMPAGSYLAACVFYSTFSGKSPLGLPKQLSGYPVEEDEGVVLKDGLAVLADLDDASAEVLQRNALMAIDLLKSSGEYLEILETPAMALPTIANGDQVTPNDLEGVWQGQTKLYPNYVPWPAEMELAIHESKGHLMGNLTISFGGRPNDIIRDQLQVTLTGDTIEFTDPKGLEGGVIRYRGTRVKDGLKGIAEILVKDKSVYGIGEWQLQRKVQKEDE